MKILVVDDQPELREVLHSFLEALGNDVHEAASLAQARALVAEHKFAWLFVDRTLPDGDGIDLIDEQLGSGAGLVVMTGHPGGGSGFTPAHTEAGVTLLGKPFSLRSIRALLG